MSECEVLRCTNPAGPVVQWGPPGGPALEGVVCDEHHARMQAGEAWVRDEDGIETQGSAFLMGADLAARELATLTDVGGGPGPALPDGSRPWIMRLEGTRYGDAAPVSLSVFLDDEAARKLREHLDM